MNPVIALIMRQRADGGVDAKILRAVLVAAAVVYFSGMDAYGLGDIAAFRHDDALLAKLLCRRRPAFSTVYASGGEM